MSTNFSRRNFINTAAASAAAMTLPGFVSPDINQDKSAFTLNKNPLKLGLMTYLVGSKWDIDTIIKNCKETKFEHVQLRTTHAHGVEVTLSSAQRADVKKKFADAGLAISLASAFQYHSTDPAELRKNI